MRFSFADFQAALRAGHRLTDDDVLALRREIWPDGVVSQSEAEALFAIDRGAGDAGPAWRTFFVEAITDYVVLERKPRYYVDEVSADWLIAQIEAGGEPIDAAELDLVVKVLEQALNCPERLKHWALGQVEQAVLTGTGPTRKDAGAPRPNVIDEAEVASLRRIVFAAGGEGACTVSREEADMLWRLKDACLIADNAPGWRQLFVQGVGNHLMAHSDYHPLARAEAARLEAFVDDHQSSVLGFFGRMLRAGPVEGIKDLRAPGTARRDSFADEDEARAITPDEQAWLDAHVDADGIRDPYEKALLAFIASERA